MQRGCGSKHGDNGKSGYGCNHTAERLVAAPPPPLTSPTPIYEGGGEGEWEEISTAIKFVADNNGYGGGRLSIVGRES